jgi:hypothetical protein
VHDFAARIHTVIDTLDDNQKQQLLRLKTVTTASGVKPRRFAFH